MTDGKSQLRIAIELIFVLSITAKLPTHEQHADTKIQRETQLQQRRSLYEWGDDKTYSDLPGFVKAADVKALPKDHQFTEEAQYDLLRAKTNGLVNLGLVYLSNLCDDWDDFDDYRKVFRDMYTKWQLNKANITEKTLNLHLFYYYFLCFMFVCPAGVHWFYWRRTSGSRSLE